MPINYCSQLIIIKCSYIWYRVNCTYCNRVTCGSWLHVRHIAPTFWLEPVKKKKILSLFSVLDRLSWAIANTRGTVSYDFVSLLAFFHLLRFSILSKDGNSPTHHQPSEWLSELGSASSLSVVKMDCICRDEERQKKYGWESEYCEVKHRPKWICKSYHVKPGIRLIPHSF